MQNEENLLLLFCYDSAIIDTNASFSCLVERIRINFEAFRNAMGQNLPFVGFIFPFLKSHAVWRNSSSMIVRKSRRKRIFLSGFKDAEMKWLFWVVDLAIGEMSEASLPPSSPALNDSNASTNSDMALYDWPWIDPVRKNVSLGYKIKNWIVEHPVGFRIPVIASGYHRLSRKQVQVRFTYLL